MHDLLVKVGQQLRQARGVPPVPHQAAHHSKSGQDADPSGTHAAVSIICDALALAFRGIGVGIDRVSFLEEREREECGAPIRGLVRDSSRHVQIGHTGESFFDISSVYCKMQASLAKGKCHSVDDGDIKAGTTVQLVVISSYRIRFRYHGPNAITGSTTPICPFCISLKGLLSDIKKAHMARLGIERPMLWTELR